jgi:DNA-binding beta-propeller fold protein YncE
MKTTIAFAALAIALIGSPAAAQTSPRYEADRNWPLPFPDRWVTGGYGGLCVDRRDHVLLLNRQDVLDGELNAGRLAPPMIELDPSGKVAHAWGDMKIMDQRLHSCHFDKDNNVWVAAAPSGMVQKFTPDGSKLLLQMGKKGVFDTSDGTVKGTPLNSNAAVFHMPSSIWVDPGNGEVYVADGESRNSNQRIAVMDREGKFLRQWRPQGMDTVHCMIGSNDGMVYVCNRENARIQLYDKQGNFLKNIEVPWQPITPGQDGKMRWFGGASVAMDFSRDANQSLIFIINQQNSQVEIIERLSGKPLASFGSIGKLPGQFDQIHGIAVDSKNNVYLAENRGRRVHKFRLAN